MSRDPEFLRAVGSASARMAKGRTASERAAARQELAELKIRAAIERTLSRFGPISDDQRSRIVALLSPSAEGGKAA